LLALFLMSLEMWRVLFINTKFIADNELSIPPKYRELMGGMKN
jgi:hypothetical protein